MKFRFFFIKSLVLLFILLIPSYGWTKSSRVAILPWKVNSAENIDFVRSALADMMLSRIGSSPALEVIAPEAVKAHLKDKSEISDSLAAEVGRKTGADYVLYGSLTVIGSAASMDARLLNVKDGSVNPFYSKGAGMDSIIPMADKVSSYVVAFASGGGASQTIAPVQKAQTNVAEVKETLPKQGPKASREEGFIIKATEAPASAPAMWKSGPMEGLYTAVTAADADKDGIKELFILGRKGLIIARRGKEGLDTVKEIKAATGVDFISIAVIDSDSDGAPEVYISGFKNNKPYGTVVEFRDNEYGASITGVGFFMRTIDDGRGGAILIGQRFRRPDGFYGDLRVLKKEGPTIVDKGPFEIILPKKVDIYRFELVDLARPGEGELAAFDDRDFLQFYKKGKSGKWEKGWKSKDFYGGTLNSIDFEEEGSGSGAPEGVAVEGRFFQADLDNNGKKEIIIKRNVPGGLGRYGTRPGSYKTGEVLSLSFNDTEGALVENWKTKQVNGYIADFFIDDLDGDGSKEIIMLVVEGTETLTGTPKSYVLSYRLAI